MDKGEEGCPGPTPGIAMIVNCLISAMIIIDD